MQEQLFLSTQRMKIPEKSYESGSLVKWLSILFVFALFLLGSLISQIKKVVFEEEYRTYISSSAEYAPDFPDTFQLSFPAHWSHADHGRSGYRNQEFLRATFNKPSLITRSHIKIHWQTRDNTSLNIVDWFRADVMVNDNALLGDTKQIRRMELSGFHSAVYELENGFIILTPSTNAYFAIVIYSKDDTLALQLHDEITSSFVIRESE